MSPDSSSKIDLSLTMDENLFQLLKHLRKLKNSGDLDDDESLANQTLLWRNRLEYKVLEKCLKHHDEEMRLVALGVLVESKKSTQTFTKIELDMITTFLRYNLGERMEYVPLIKKAIKRIKESLAVLRRQVAREEKIKECENQVKTGRELYEKLREETSQVAQESLSLIQVYRDFFRSFRDICLNGLCPGSTNSRKRSSLQMLQLGQEFLDHEFLELPWSAEHADRLFECLLLDTYEMNKEIIYKIAKGIEPSLLRLNDAERVREIIDVALDLGNCIRPIDSITASYMLKISLLSPVIKKVLENYEIMENLPLETAEGAILKLITIVVERLKGPLKLAEDNIVAASGKHSLYGYLFCIRNLIGMCDLGKVVKQNHQVWTRLIGEIIEISFRLNNAVSQIVNNSSPEGHLPMDMETSTLSSVIPDNETTNVTPQMVLLCSWRTVKEVSLLFGYLASKSPISDDEKTELGLLSEKQLVEIGEHLVTLLFETKHRGAFEQAHVGFGQLCNRLWRLNHENLKKQPKIWLHHLLLAVSGLSPGNAKLCATRRSAGVPFMVQALVSSDPFVQNDPASAVFHSVMKILLGFTDLEDGVEISRKTKSLMYQDTIFSDLQDIDSKNDESFDSSERKNHEILMEIKTHALNILRALFKHAQLGDLARTYAADGLSAAIRSYDGKNWAERNAATLLFSSLITRIFGVQRTKDHVNLTLHNKMTGRIFFERYPSLLPFMLNELCAFVDASDTLIKPSVQSILLLLSRLYPSFNSDDADSKWEIEEFIKLVSACAKSKVYKTRELAARALVPLLTEKTVQTFIVQLFDKIVAGRENGLSFNALHGYMLQIFEIMKSPQFKINELSRARVNTFIAGTGWILENLESMNNRSACFPLGTIYVAALSELVQTEFEIEEYDQLFDRLVPHLNISRILKQRPGREIYELAVAKFFISTMENRSYEANYRDKSHDAIIIAWNSVLSSGNVQVQIAGWSEVSRVIEKTLNKKLLDIAIFVALNNIIRKIIDPDLQDVVYDFLYDILMKSAESSRITFHLDSHSLNNLCSFIVTVLASHMQMNHFQESLSFMRLLGKAYGTLSQSYKDEYLTVEYKRSIYKTFLENTWMGSADTGCRIAISSVLQHLFIESTNSRINDYCLSLDWWTSLLNLLVDDNSEVRTQASLVVCKIEPSTELECISSMMDHFFDKFLIHMREKPSVVFAAFFAWSTTLSGDTDYEMDDSDVFNKCYNYEIFEPLRISDLCHKNLESLLANYSIDEELPIEVGHWLNERLGSTMEFVNFRELIVQYRKNVPIIDPKLDDVIDPTHNDKLLQAIAYERFALISS